jgi:hypothetical protein
MEIVYCWWWSLLKKIAYITYLHNTLNKLSSRFAMLATWHSCERNVTLNYCTNEGHVHAPLPIDWSPASSFLQAEESTGCQCCLGLKCGLLLIDFLQICVLSCTCMNWRVDCSSLISCKFVFRLVLAWIEEWIAAHWFPANLYISYLCL